MATIREFITKWGFRVDDKGLRDLDQSVRRSAKGVNKLREGFKNVAIGIGATLAAVKTFQLGKAILQIADDAEKAEIAFETMLGSSEKAQKTLQDLNAFAAKTPFTLTGIRQNAQQLLGMGIESEKLVPTLKALGDVSAGLSVPLERLALNFGQVRARGKLTGQELRDFQVAGVPITAQLAKQLNVAESAIADMVSRGEIGFPEVEKAFIAMTSAGGKFNNLMIRQSKTFGGIVSNIGDFFEILAQDIGKQLLPAAKEMAVEFLNFVEANRELIKSQAVEFFATIFKFSKKVFTVMKFLFGIITEIADLFGGFGAIAEFLINLFLTLTGLKLLKILRPLLSIFATLKSGSLIAGGLGAAFAKALAKLKPLTKYLQFFGLILGTIFQLPFLLIDDFAGFLEGKDSVFGSIGDFLIKTFDTIENYIFTFIDNVIKGFSWLVDSITAFFREFAAFLFQVFTTPFDLLLSAIRSLLTLIPQNLLSKAGLGNIAANIEKAQTSLTSTIPDFISGNSSSQANTTNSNVQNNTININGAQNPAATARAVNDVITRQQTSQQTRRRNAQ